MQIKFNRNPRPDGKSDQADMAAQLRAAQQSGVQPKKPQQHMPGMEPLNLANPQQRNPQNPQQAMPQTQRTAPVPSNTPQTVRSGNPQNPQQANPQTLQQTPVQNLQQTMQSNTGISRNPQTQGTAQTNAAAQSAEQAKIADIFAAAAAEAGIAAAQPQTAAAETAPQTEKVPETHEKTDDKAEAPTAPKKSARPNLEDILRDMVGQNVRVHTVDHENGTGRLEAVEDGFIKLVNVRSAGTDYYADEDMISIPHIVKIRAVRTIEKEYYNEFMNR